MGSAQPLRHSRGDGPDARYRPHDGTRVRKTTYTGCAGGADVALYAIENGGHTWPGGSQYLPRGIVGRVCRDIDATRVIWEFFTAHPKP